MIAGCGAGEEFSSEQNKCRPCFSGMYASATDEKCLFCPRGYTNAARGATDISSCTSMYTF